MHDRPSRAVRVLALLLVASITAAACSRDDGSTADGPRTSTTATGGPTSTSPGDTDPGSRPSPVQDGIRIEVLSSQPDRVTGPEARIRVTPARDGRPDDLRIELDGRDVTGQLPVAGGTREGVVSGLVEGTNTLTARADGSPVSQRLRSWPVTGPMISGPHLPLLACSTEAHGLGAPEDADCSAPTRVTWRYVTTDHRIADLPDPTARPADLATATIGGRRGVPLVIRHEVGVVNRSVYEIASVDPSPGGADRDQSDAAWNHRLLYRYGGGCGSSFGQGTATTTALDAGYLEQGYALATATFNTAAVQCNDVLSAETTMMVKERFVEAFGEPTFTIGEGSSGGAIQLHLLAQNYPGLIDGAVALQPFPDVVTVASGVADCGLLQHYYRSAAGSTLTDRQRVAVNGHATTGTCRNWERSYLGTLDPTDGCDPAIPAAELYDPATNPTGLRCTVQDANINQYGRDPATGFARRPLDNVGVQYGLAALNDGAITVDQFVALNEAIGGYDIDGKHQDEREEADAEAVQAAYETGRVSTGVGDQRKIPIIEVNVFADRGGDIHDRVRAFSLRDRLVLGGSPEAAPGFQIWTREATGTGGTDRFGPEAVKVVDRWLTAIEGDTEGGDREEVLTRARPEAAVDNCLPPGRTEPLVGIGIYDDRGPCRDRYPIAGSPRIAAGAPRSDDVLKCQLKPVDLDDYEVDLTMDQYDRIVAAFPDGVCDWTSPGVGQTTPSMTDRSYEDVVTPEQLA